VVPARERVTMQSGAVSSVSCPGSEVELPPGMVPRCPRFPLSKQDELEELHYQSHWPANKRTAGKSGGKTKHKNGSHSTKPEAKLGSRCGKGSHHNKKCPAREALAISDERRDITVDNVSRSPARLQSCTRAPRESSWTRHFSTQ
jgi:hypothetical protein